MKRYWDASGLVEALHDESLRLKVTKGSAVTRSHSFSEVFSTLTGGRLGFRYAPDDAAGIISSLAKDLEVVDLSLEESLAALSQAGRVGVRGGRVHDFLHAEAARKAGVERLVTLNTSDFVGLLGREVEITDTASA
jgi:predicted nucleic acid-binding protein